MSRPLSWRMYLQGNAQAVGHGAGAQPDSQRSDDSSQAQAKVGLNASRGLFASAPSAATSDLRLSNTRAMSRQLSGCLVWYCMHFGLLAS